MSEPTRRILSTAPERMREIAEQTESRLPRGEVLLLGAERMPRAFARSTEGKVKKPLEFGQVSSSRETSEGETRDSSRASVADSYAYFREREEKRLELEPSDGKRSDGIDPILMEEFKDGIEVIPMRP
jgi:hypothetical protein